MKPASTVLLGCALLLCCSRVVPNSSEYTSQIETEHRLEARGSFPKRDLRRETVFLFIGSLSILEGKERRNHIRNTWGRAARDLPVVDQRFFLESQDKTTSQDELAVHNDLAYVPAASNYRTAVIKTYFILEYAYVHLDFRFILKTDDDTFVNVRPLIQELQSICQRQDCRQAKLYMGQMNKAGAIKALHAPDGKPSQYFNAPYYNRTGLEYYPAYMVGGGYLVTSDIASALIAVNSYVGLSVFHLEDANFGFWMSSWDVHYMNHPQFSVLGMPVVERHVHANGSSQLRLRSDLSATNHFCSDRPWLLLHKAINEEMDYIMGLTDKCKPDAVMPAGKVHS